MATSSQVKAALDNISQAIATERQAMANCKARITASKQLLAALPTTYAEVVATINAYVPNGAFESLAKDELAKMAAEFTALKNAATTAETGLASITEF